VHEQFEHRVSAIAVTVEQEYKGPAVNHNATNPRVPLVVRPEIPTMVEAGLKNSFLDGRFAVNVSAFTMKIKDYQATIWDPAAVAFIFTNAPELTNRGVTVNFYGKPTNALTVNGGAAYIQSKLGPGFLVECAMGSAPGCTRDASGDRAGGVPKLRATLAADYRFLLASMRASVGADVVYTSEKVFDRTDPARNLPATTIVGARFGIRTADDKVGVTLYARNLFDKFSPTYRIGNLIAFATGDTHSYTQFLGPESRRVLGVSLDAKF
jgi:iron complex outermembrane recepter protein